MALLDVSSVCKSFGALKAVHAVTFQVTDGEIFGIAGPNGSGKSTLFDLITRIPFGPDSGRVVFDGKDLAHQRAHKIVSLGMVRTFQREVAFESLNVFENVWLSASFGTSSNVTAGHVKDMLDLMGFTHADLARSARNLSVFERKRLTLASALACNPKLILLDEPASGLTKPEIEQTITLIRRMATKGITILLIEHVLPFLMALSQRLMVLNNGQVLGIGKPFSIMKERAVMEAYLGNRKVTRNG